MESARWNKDLAASYARVSERYAEQFFAELDRKPPDRALFDDYAAAVRERGRVCDVGCGPGYVKRYLSLRGVDVFGMNISPDMLAVARRLNPSICFEEGNMLSLNLAGHSLEGLFRSTH